MSVSRIILDNPSWHFLDFDHKRDEITSIRLLQEPPSPGRIPKDADINVMHAYAPELSGANLEFIKQGIDSCRLELTKAQKSVSIPQQSAPLHNSEKMTIRATVHQRSNFFPTHIFGVLPTKQRARDMKGARKSTTLTLYPVHGLVFALQCTGSTLPSPPEMLVSEPKACADGREILLPVLPLRVPYPEGFQLLLNYLYTNELDALLTDLTPPDPPQHPHPHAKHPIAILLDEPTENILIQYAQYLSQTHPAETLVKHIMTTHGFWLNLCSLRVLDGRLWRAIRMTWAVLIQALEMSVGKPDVYVHVEGPDGHQLVPKSTTNHVGPDESTTMEGEPWMDGCVIA